MHKKLLIICDTIDTWILVYEVRYEEKIKYNIVIIIGNIDFSITV